MKKLSALSLFAALSCTPSLYAGMMGNVEAAPCLSSFFLLEGGYAGNQLQGFDFGVTDTGSHIKSKEKNTSFAGILSAGMSRSVTEEFAVTSEIGYGYYGQTKHTPTSSGLAQLNIQHNLTGFDALAGVAYTDIDFNLYFKAGALVATRTTKTTADLSTLGFSQPPLILSFEDQTHHTAVLPEIKIGGAYNFDSNWAITLSYLHAFGTSTKTTGNINLTANTITFNQNQQNPSIDAVLLGIQVSV